MPVSHRKKQFGQPTNPLIAAFWIPAILIVTVRAPTRSLTVPSEVRRRAGIKISDQLEFKVSGGIITILPKLHTADDEYTPEQRRIIDARMAESEEDFKKGRSFGPFNTAGEMIAHMKAQLKKRAPLKKLNARDEG